MNKSDTKSPQDNLTVDSSSNNAEHNSSSISEPSVSNSEATISQSSTTSETDDLANLEMGEDSNPESLNVAADVNQTSVQPMASSANLNNQAQKTQKKKFGLIIGIIIAILILIGGGAAAYKILVINNQPQNFLDRAISTTASQKKPLRIVQKITPSAQDQDNTTTNTITGETLLNPETKMVKHQFKIDHLLIGKANFDLVVDINKHNFYIKIDLDKKLLNIANVPFFNPLQSRYPIKPTNLIEQIYNKINNQWFLINEDILKELMEESGMDVDSNSIKNSKDLIAKCQNSKDFSFLKFVEVKQELDKKDHYRRFEVKFSKSMLKDSIDKHPDNQCLQEIKKSLDKSDFDKANTPKTVITVDSKTMLIKDIQMSDKNSIVDIEMSYNSTDTIELPKDAKPLSQLKSLIEDVQKSFILELSTPSDSL